MGRPTVKERNALQKEIRILKAKIVTLTLENEKAKSNESDKVHALKECIRYLL